MQYIGTDSFEHGRTGRIGVLITNLGTPRAPEKAALKTYLRQFLWDPRVVEIPRPLWWLILHGIILNVRPARSAEAYRAIWTPDGSPLRVHTEAQAEARNQPVGPIAKCGSSRGSSNRTTVTSSSYASDTHPLVVFGAPLDV